MVSPVYLGSPYCPHVKYTTLVTYLRWRSDWLYHPLQHLHPRLLARLPQADAHVLQHWGVSDKGTERVALNVGGPLVLVRLGGTDTDIA